jgi:effector-binding domain-containing protein
MLLTTQDSVLEVALSCGFQSHEAFCRAFRRRFRRTPSAYRERGFATGASPPEADEYAHLVTRIGVCIRLFHSSEHRKPKRNNMSYSITKRELSPQPVLVVRRRVRASDLAAVLAEVLPHVFQYAHRTGTPLAGQPFTRYLEWGPGLLTIEAGMPTQVLVPGDDAITADKLPGGLVATTMHAGPYDALADAHAAIQGWIEDNGFIGAGGPWESYVTDPADYPDPKDWKTEVFWPIVSQSAAAQ